MKKIVIYINSMASSGGIERVISNLSKQLSENYELILITKDKERPYYSIPFGTKHYSLNIPLRLDMHSRSQRAIEIMISFIKTIKKLRLVLNMINPDYVYVTNPINDLEAYIALKKPEKRLVISEHGSYYGYNKIYTMLKKIIYPKSYVVSVPNITDTKIYKKWKCNAVYIPHLVTYEPALPNSLDTKIVLNVGRLTSDKQQELLLSIWSKIKNKNGWVLWIVGEGEEKERLAKKINTLKIENSVKLIPATKRIGEIYKQASLFAFTSRNEGFGMVLLEAMSFGIPCISFDCPSGPRDVVKDGYNGFLIENMNEDEYAKKLQEMILMSDSELQELGNNAFETVKNWDNEGILAKWDAVFK